MFLISAADALSSICFPFPGLELIPGIRLGNGSTKQTLKMEDWKTMEIYHHLCGRGPGGSDLEAEVATGTDSRMIGSHNFRPS